MPEKTVKAPSPETKEALLDAAERLFAEKGFAGASLRAITQAAGANLAAVNYHFGSKEGLIRAVFARKLGPLNQQRMALLDAAEAAGSPALEEIVRAFTAPVIRMIRDTEGGGREFASLVGRAMSRPDEGLRPIVLEEFRAVRQRFVAALALALPDLDGEELFWRVYFMVGAMAHTAASSGLIEWISGGRYGVSDTDRLTERLVAFLCGGLRANIGGEARG